jgi:hypothetical protein
LTKITKQNTISLIYIKSYTAIFMSNPFEKNASSSQENTVENKFIIKNILSRFIPIAIALIMGGCGKEIIHDQGTVSLTKSEFIKMMCDEDTKLISESKPVTLEMMHKLKKAGSLKIKPNSKFIEASCHSLYKNESYPVLATLPGVVVMSPTSGRYEVATSNKVMIDNYYGFQDLVKERLNVPSNSSFSFRIQNMTLNGKNVEINATWEVNRN